MDWQPIETAPKDGTWILLEGEFAGGNLSSVTIGRWNPIFDRKLQTTYEWQAVSNTSRFVEGPDDTITDPFDWYADGVACGWHPLPPPPPATKADSDGDDGA